MPKKVLYYNMIKKGKNKDMSNEVFISNDFETFWVPEDGYTLVPLHSVSAMLCTQAGSESEVLQGQTFPMLVEGGWDTNAEVHLEDTCDEWFDALSDEDRVVVNRVMEIL